MDLPLQPPPPPTEVRKKLADRPDRRRTEHLERLLAIAEGRRPATMRLPIRALAVGRRLCILALAHECFADYQLYVERVSPFPHNLVFAYTNGVECYGATAKDYRRGEAGGYEAAPAGAAARYEVATPPAPRAEGLIKRAIGRVLGAVGKDAR